MKISIAMATYNGAKYLREQLESFNTQIRKPDELVVCDDASTDETIDILNEYKSNVSFDMQVYVNPANLGYVQNFNKALSLCTGDFVFLSDQDDVWFKDKISTLAEEAAQDLHSVVFMNDAELTLQDLTPTGLTKLGQIRSAGLSDELFIMGSCAAVRRNFLKKVLPIPSQILWHDGWIVGLAIGLKRRHIVERSLQLYRRHEENSSVVITSKVRKISKIFYYGSKVISGVKKSDLKTLRDRRECMELLSKKAQEMNQLSNDDTKLQIDLAEFVDMLHQQTEALSLRIVLSEKPRITRLPIVLTMLRQGKYRHFSGIRSACLDLIKR